MKIYDMLSNSRNEKDVENYYRSVIQQYFSHSITSPHSVDGYLSTVVDTGTAQKKLDLIMEFKYDVNLDEHINVSKILIQVLYYLKKFENSGDPIPNVILVGTEDRSFVLHANELTEYLEEKINWDIAPSSAYSSNPELLSKINNNSLINPFIFKIDKRFDFTLVVEKIKDIVANNNRRVRITQNNISGIYEYFIQNVLKNSEKYDANELVSLFISTMLYKDEVYLHPKKNNILVINGKDEISVNTRQYNAFFSQFQQEYKPSEKRVFTEISDRLIEDTNRRKKGEFYTPTSFVKYGFNLLTEHLGRGWEKSYTVWDSAWGTGNLTRDYDFKKLYASTINQSDLDMANQYNASATKFQYDFLNEDSTTFDPNSFFDYDQDSRAKNVIQDMIEKPDSPFLFYINPPYATGGNANSKEKKSKKELAKTRVGDFMRSDKLKVSEQLYAQFLYRIINMKKNFGSTHMYVALYSPTLYMTGSKYDKFRELFLSEFEFVDGAMFKADNFADVKGNWAISFTIWKSKPSKKTLINEFNHRVIELNSDGVVTEIGEKKLYNLDNQQSLQDYIGQDRELPNTKEIKSISIPTFSSAFKYSEKLSEIRLDYFGVLVNDTNNIEATTKGCYLMPSKISRNLKTITIISENFFKATSTFTIRNIQKANWINQKDEFRYPETDNEDFKQFERLSVIYSIFSPKNNIVSYRDIEVNNTKYSGVNEWFFMSRENIQELADNNNNGEIYEDTHSYGGERFVYQFIQENYILLPEIGKLLLEKAENLIINTMKYRSGFSKDNEKYYLDSWDASWSQLKPLFSLYANQELLEFNKLYSEYEEYIRKFSTRFEFVG